MEIKDKIFDLISKITACNDGALAIIQNEKIEAFSAETLLENNKDLIDELYSFVDENIQWGEK